VRVYEWLRGRSYAVVDDYLIDFGLANFTRQSAFNRVVREEVATDVVRTRTPREPSHSDPHFAMLWFGESLSVSIELAKSRSAAVMGRVKPGALPVVVDGRVVEAERGGVVRFANGGPDLQLSDVSSSREVGPGIFVTSLIR